MKEALGHGGKTPALARPGRRQFRDQQVRHHRSGVHQGADAERRQHVPVCQHAPGYRAKQNGGDSRGLHQAIGLHQLIAGGQLAENAVFGRRVGRRANAHQRIANKWVKAHADTQRPEQLQPVGEHHYPSLSKAVRHLTNKGREEYVSTYKHHLQDWLAPVRIELSLEQRQGGKQQGVITKRREELGGSHRQHALRQQRIVRAYWLMHVALPPRRVCSSG